VVVTVIPVRVMQVPVDQVVDVVAMRHRLVAATRPVHVVWIVLAAGVLRRAFVRVRRGHRQRVLLDRAVGTLMVQVPVVKVVDVALVLDGSVTTTGAMLMLVIVVMMRHGAYSFPTRTELNGFQHVRCQPPAG
jgi:hypothetical protein